MLLLRDRAIPGRYLTLDRWRNEGAFRAFRSAFATQYVQLDTDCEHLTESEMLLGEFSATRPAED